jgi:pyruvate dehydrogenase E1 component
VARPNQNNSNQNNSNKPNLDVLNSIAKRAHYLATQMIFMANNRSDKEKGDPKVGGHVSASASSLHIMGALHLLVKSGFDHIANKPHASPTDHSYNYLLELFLRSDFEKMSLEDCNQAMRGLRAFSQNGEPVFQSYHSAFDCDHHNFFPSGTVGIPPVNAGYLALAYRYAKEHGYDVPEAHFWAVAGDSEFREGSMYEAIPDFAEREIGNLTWIIDYNRQSLDGHRITNERIMGGNDAMRIERTMTANGWEVIQVRHGSKREALFKKTGGDLFKKFLETELKDYELQALLLVRDMTALKKGLAKEHPGLKKFLENVSDNELFEALRDFGGHDIFALADAMEKSKLSKDRPTLIIAHTIKGWGLKMAATPGNHSALLNSEEMDQLRAAQGISNDEPFARFPQNSPEGKFLQERGSKLYREIRAQADLKKKNQQYFQKMVTDLGEPTSSMDISTKMASYPHTQWMLGQLTAKLTRIANTPLKDSELKPEQKALTDSEKPWKVPGELLVSMAPDVGTSTNLNPAMDGKIFGAPVVADYETELGVKDVKTPDLVPGEEVSDRYLRFEIAEGNVMSCMGSFGRLRDILGIPILPLMTVYDFFIKRALDQYFYNLYWKSSFILVGTPSGVTLSPEGAQHGWKSDIQIPNQITWEPFFCQELDWILCDSIRRHYLNDNEGRNGVLIRGVTRGIEQKDFLHYLRKQFRFKENPQAQLCRSEFAIDGGQDEAQVAAMSDESIFARIRQEVLKGAYYLINYQGYAGYEPGDNVVHIFSMGSPTTEAIQASEKLLAKGIYANVIVVTSSDLLCGIPADHDNYEYLTTGLGINGSLYIRPTEELNGHELVTVAGRRVPIVSVHDGEAGLLDNLGSVVGVKQISLAVRKHSKCGRPKDIYQYHHLDAESIVEACGKVLADTALEQVQVSQTVLSQSRTHQGAQLEWKDLWPSRPESRH